MEKQSKNLATDLAEKIREMEIAFNEIKYKKTIEITEMSEKLEGSMTAGVVELNMN